MGGKMTYRYMVYNATMATTKYPRVTITVLPPNQISISIPGNRRSVPNAPEKQEKQGKPQPPEYRVPLTTGPQNFEIQLDQDVRYFPLRRLK